MTSALGVAPLQPCFHLDEHFSPAIAVALRKRGIDATTTQSAGLLHADDEAQFRFAQSNNRVFVTCDEALMVAKSSTMVHCGIVFFPSGPRSIGDTIESLVVVAGCLTAAEVRGRILFM